MNYYISDIHFGHEAVINKCGRPFFSAEEMDGALIASWNSKVKRGDTVFILGDLIHKSKNSPEYYLERLNGKKILILGNHDEAWLQKVNANRYFFEVTKYKEAYNDGNNMTLCHYPMLEWKNSRKVGSDKLGYLIFGHIHNKTDRMYEHLFSIGNALNCGVEVNGYEPVTFDELLANNDRFKLSIMEGRLKKAEYLCRRYHMHQHDRAGAAYEKHPMYVASRFEGEEEKIVALLHDTLEDTDIPLELISELFGIKVLDAVKEMTRGENEDYFEYIKRLSLNSIARAVKTEDLKHNMDMSRLKEIGNADIARKQKYEKALSFLSNI